MSRQTPEYRLQCAAVQYLTRRRLLHYHPKNQTQRAMPIADRARMAAQERAMGVRSGVSDLVVIGAGGLSLHIELKAGRGKLRAAQQIFAHDLAAIEAPCYLARSLSELENIIDTWLYTVASGDLPGAWRSWAKDRLGSRYAAIKSAARGGET